MWDRINKVIVVNAIGIIIILVCSIITIIAAWHEIPASSKELISKYFDMSLVGVIGWAFTQSKMKNQ